MNLNNKSFREDRSISIIYFRRIMEIFGETYLIFQIKGLQEVYITFV